MTINSSIRTFRGAVGIVTGAASGLGKALAAELCKRGSTIVLVDRQVEEVEAAARSIRDAGGIAIATTADVRDFNQVERIVNDTAAKYGRLDYMFNNAGISVGGYLHRLTIEECQTMVDVNVKGVMHGCYAAYKIMLEQGFGHIVNTGSIVGLLPGFNIYAASKHAIVGLSNSLRIEAALNGIRVSTICPGSIRTPMLYNGGKYGGLRDVPEELIEKNYHRKKNRSPEEIAVMALRGIEKNKAIIVVPFRFNIGWLLFRLSPSFIFSVGTKGMRASADYVIKKGYAIFPEKRDVAELKDAKEM